MAREVELKVKVNDSDVTKTTASLGRLRSAAEGVGKGISIAGVAIGSALGGFIQGAIQQLTAQLGQAARSVIEYSSNLEQAKTGFETLMGSASAAEKHLKDLQDFAKTTPFQFPDLVTASRRLQNVGLAASEVIPVMRDIGNAAAAAGASSSELDMITLAMSQIIAKGKLSAEEVNQLAERGIPVWKMLEEQLGRSKGEIIKLAEQGKISSDIFLSAFQKFSQAHFGDAMEKQSHTFAGAMSNISDAVMIAASTSFKPLFDEISKFADRVATSLSDQEEKAKGAGASFGFAIAEAIGKGMRGGLSGEGSFLKTIGSYLSTELLAQNLSRGFQQGLNSFDDTALFGGRKMKLDSVTNTLVEVGNAAKNTDKNAGDLAKTLSEQLKTSAEDAQKRAEMLKNTVLELGLQIRYFGDDSQAATVKQKLLGDGITDLNSGMAGQAVAFAERLDKLKAAKKEEDDYTSKIKDLRKELQQMSGDANFEMRFADATELQKFDRWVKENASSFRELKGEIDRTRDSIKSAQIVAGIRESSKAVKDVINEIDSTLNNANVSGFDTKLQEIARSLSLQGFFDQFKVDVTPETFSHEIQGYLDAYEKFLDTVGGDARRQQLDDAREALRKFLMSFTDKNGLAVIGDQPKELDAFIDRIIKLRGALQQSSSGELIGGLRDEIQRLNVELGKSAEESMKDAIAKKGIGTVIGAAVGAIAGGLIGLFGGDKNRKQDKKENVPALRQGFVDAFKQLNDILSGIRSLKIDPDEAISQASAIRAEMQSGFGISFLSKKYKKQAASEIQQNLSRADSIINEIRSAAEIARGAADRSKRILPEFAGGHYFADFFRPNGLIPGSFDGADNILAMISRGEMVINPRQQSMVRALAGFDVFAGAGIPNYPNASTSPKLATGGIAGTGLALASVTPQINVQPNFTLELHGVHVEDAVDAYLVSDKGVRTQINVQKRINTQKRTSS
jgi:tape measure domain-containing protein